MPSCSNIRANPIHIRIETGSGQTVFKNYLAGLDHMRCEIKKNAIRKHKMDTTVIYHEPCPLFAMIFACYKYMESQTSYFCVHYAKISYYSVHRATPINPLLFQECYPYSMPGNIILQQTYSLHEATSTFVSHVLVSASLRVATPTNPSRYLFGIVCMHC